MTEPNDEDRERARQKVTDADRELVQEWSASLQGNPEVLSVYALELLSARARAAGSLALAACEAREAKALEALARLDALYISEHDPNVAARPMWLSAALSAPRDSGALRAFGERVALTVLRDQLISESGKVHPGAEPGLALEAAAIVARILSGGADA